MTNENSPTPGNTSLIATEGAPYALEWVPVKKLRSAKRNARTHSKNQIQQIANAIIRFGIFIPIVIDTNDVIVSGHARVAAAKLLGSKAVPAIRASHLSDAELRAYALADNKLAEGAGWDREILRVELTELQLELPKLNLDLTITGFTLAEADELLTEQEDRGRLCADTIPNLAATAISREGDIFLLGRHRLGVGDARDARFLEKLLQGERATMGFLDPPYNVPVSGHVGGRGRIRHREFKHASGEMTQSEFTAFLKQTLTVFSQQCVDGAIIYVCMDWRHGLEVLTAGADAFSELKNICVWTKTTPGQGSFYRSQHEFIYVFKKGTAAHINTFELGQHGRTRTNVWSYPGVNAFRAGRMDELKMHPTVKPVALVIDAMKDCSQRNSIVLDTFAGSGTTIVAAEQVERRAYCVEIDPLYVDVAIRRWQQLTRKDALLAVTGQTFDEVTADRKRSAA